MSKNKDIKKLLSGLKINKTSKINPLKRLSLCMIVKNEESNLGRCLESVKDVVDEIIIVDTGSTDNTINIAKEYGAKIYNYEWNNDFGSARNYSIDKATGDWILVLDADEEIPSECKDNIRSLLIDIDLDIDIAFNIRIKNISSDILDPTQSINNYMVRMFINKPNIRYTGKIHEYINLHSINLSEDSIYIIHHGYKDPTFSLKKQTERNIPIFDEILNNPKTSQEEKTWIKFYSGSAKIQTNEREKGIKLLEEFITETKDFSGGGPLSLAYFMLMSDASYNDPERLKELLEQAENTIPQLENAPEYWNYKGMLAYTEKNYEEGLDCFIKSVELNKSESQSFSMMVIETTYVSSILNICYLSLHLNKLDIFNKYFDIVKEKYIHINKYKLIISELYKLSENLEEFYKLNLEISESTNDEKEKKASIRNISNYYLEKGDYIKAIEYQSKLHETEESKHQWHKLAHLSIINDNLDQAKEIYCKIIEIYPEDIETYLLLGKLLITSVNKKEGLEYLYKAYTLSNNDTDKIKVFNTYMELSLTNELELLIDTSLNKDPENYAVNFFKSNILISKRNYEDAENLLKDLIKKFPDNLDSYIDLGNLLLNTEDNKGAVDVFEKALSINNKDIRIIDTLALLYFDNKNYNKALQLINIGLEIEPDNLSLKFLEEEINNKMANNQAT